MSVKKVIVISIFGLLSIINLFSQSIEKTIEKVQIGSISSKIFMTIDGSDTSYSLFCSFQNRKYQHINDIGSVYFHDYRNSLTRIEEFVQQLESCIQYMEEGGTTYRIGNLVVYDFSPQLYVMDGKKYTTLTKRQVVKWIKWLNEVVLGKVE